MRLLLAEDNDTTRLMLVTTLTRWGYDVVPACDGTEAWRLLNEPEHPALVLLDWMMPGMDGPEIVRRLRSKETALKHYVIIMTSRDEKKDIVDALDGGADDYIVKPYDIDELRARIGVGRRVVGLHALLAKQMHELEETHATISRLACTDVLTTLPNRRSFNDIYAGMIGSARRHGHPLALVMIDLDRFKSVNDTYGHDAGDLVLKGFADLLKEALRAEDFAARWGGEEFIILVPHAGAEAAVLLAERIRAAFAGSRRDGIDLPLSASFGVAALDDGESGDSLMRRADGALMRAKQEGRNRVVVSP